MSIQKFIIQGILYRTRDIPKISTISGADKPKKDQMWERPDDIPMGKDIDDELLDREWDRIEHGFWFMNNGKPTYISGFHYFFLVYYVLEDGTRPQYRRTDRDFFYFWDYLEKFTKALGCIFVKYRRQGASSRGASMMLCIAITEARARCGIVSKVGDDAEDLLHDMISVPLQSIPLWMRPQQSGNSKSKKELSFSAPAVRIGTSGKTGNTNGGGLNNRLMARDTSANAFDSGRIRFMILDEAGKWGKINVATFYQTARKMLTQGAARKGMCYCMSTVNELEKGGGKNFKILFNMSQHINQEGTEKLPPSRLYSFFIPAYDGYYGYVDQYGESIIDDPTLEQKKYLEMLYKQDICPNPNIGARQYIQEQRDELQKQVELGQITQDVLDEAIRTEPFTLKEAFLMPAKNCIVNPRKLQEQKDFIEENGDFINGLRRRVNFRRSPITGRVEMHDDLAGRWNVIWDFANPLEQSNKYIINDYGEQEPNNCKEFAMGCDQFGHSIQVGKKGSKSGAYVYRKYQPLDPDNSDMPIAQYNYRTERKGLMYMDMLLAAEYFGCKIGFEASTDDWLELFEREKRDLYLINCPKALRTANYKVEKPGILMNTDKAKEAHTSSIVESFLDNYKKIYFIELLEQIEEFDPQERTIYDLVMGYGYALITSKEEVREVIPNDLSNVQLIKTYNTVDRTNYRMN